MIVTFLGTGTSQGVPVIGCSCEVCRSIDFKDKRTRSSIHLELKGKSFTIDCGPDFREQMLREEISRLDAIIYTHEHRDHTAGLDEVRSFNFKQKQDMPLYGEARVLNQLKEEFSYIFQDNQYPGLPKVDCREIDTNPFIVNGINFTPIRVMHYKLPILGFRVNDFTYITDAKSIITEEKEKIKGSKVLVLNALQTAPHISHFTLNEALALIEELQPETAYLTHISHNLGKSRNVATSLPPNVHLAHDGLKLTL